MIEKEKPLVSVILPTYKRLNELNRAIKSILNQSYNNIEIIIINDDPEKDITKYIPSNENIKVINHSRNKGGAAARNTGIVKSDGKYIAFLDDDDFFLKKKIEKSVNLMENLTDEWIGIYSWYIKEDNRRIIKSFIDGDLSIPLLTFNKKLILGGATSLFLKSEIVKSIGGFNISYARHQDWEFLLRICKMGKLKLLKEPLFIKGQSNSMKSPEFHLRLKFKLLKDFSNLLASYSYNNLKKVYSTQFLVVAFHFLKKKKIIRSLKIFYRIFKYSPAHFISSIKNVLNYYLIQI